VNRRPRFDSQSCWGQPIVGYIRALLILSPSRKVECPTTTPIENHQILIKNMSTQLSGKSIELNSSDLKPKRTSLNDLSNELLIDIIRHISTDVQFTPGRRERPWGQRPLFLFLFTSKRLYQLTEPVLYHRFVEEFMGNPRALQLFLKRIILRPDLSKLVRVYHGCASDSQHHDNRMDVVCLKEEPIWTPINERVAQISENADEAKEWMQSIERGNWEAITALTLSLIPNLQELEFQGWSYTEEVYPVLLRFLSRVRDRQIDGSLDTTLSLRNLRKITLEYWDTEGGMRLGLLLPFLSIPSAHTFWAKMVGDDDMWDSTIHRFPHIKELSLKPANVESGLFHNFLLSFPNLDKLYYRSGYGESTLQPPRFMAAVVHLKSSLRDLSLFNENYFGADLEDFPIGDLTAFEKLEVLRMDSTMLTGRLLPTRIDGFSSIQSLYDTLPRNLRHLQIMNCQNNDCLVSEIIDLIAWKVTMFPNFETLDIEWERTVYPDKPSPTEPHKHPGFERKSALQLLEDMEAVGVEMIMPYKPPEPKFVYYTRLHEMNGAMRSVQCHHRVEYPYEDYERLCEVHGCEPTTGRRPGTWY
jgi:hypothetical protein